MLSVTPKRNEVTGKVTPNCRLCWLRGLEPAEFGVLLDRSLRTVDGRCLIEPSNGRMPTSVGRQLH